MDVVHFLNLFKEDFLHFRVDNGGYLKEEVEFADKILPERELAS